MSEPTTRRPTTRQRIVEAADMLFYQHGFDHTSFADIAGKVQLSRGNFYYHFKTKDEILDAVIDQRLANTQAMLDRWENEGADPAVRIKCFIRILTTNWSKIRLYGCPVGTLCTELAKLDHPAKPHAEQVFTLFRDWLGGQFAALGRTEDADALAMHVLAWSQGVATLASSFRDEAFVRREIDEICAWLDSNTPR